MGIPESFTDHLRSKSKATCYIDQCNEEVLSHYSSLRAHVQERHADVVASDVTEDSLIQRIQRGSSESQKPIRCTSNSNEKRLWDPRDGMKASRPETQAAQKVTPMEEALDDDAQEIHLSRSETPTSQKLRIQKTKDIYAELVMVESKCTQVDKTLTVLQPANFNDKQWEALIFLHRVLLHKHYEFLETSQHPLARSALRRLATKYEMPARMWRHGAHSLLELLRLHLPRSRKHMLSFIYMSYCLIGLLHDLIPAFEDTWIECLVDLGRYRLAIEDDPRDIEIWKSVSRDWDSKTSNKALATGRLCRHLSSATESTVTLFEPLPPLLKSSQPRTFQASGIVNGIPVEANADTGSTHNFISEEYATVIGLQVEPHNGNVRLPNGKVVAYLGQVQGSFTFQGETKAYSFTCLVMKSVAHGLVLGQRFLKLTRTFKDHQETRLRRVFSTPQRALLKLVDADQQDCIPGYLNGALCCAVPDSGSDIMVISGSYAQSRGFHADRSPESCQLVEFIDGSTQLTDGIVRNLNWQFKPGEAPVQCDFVIMDDLPVDAILSNGMVDELDIFRHYDHLLTAIDPEHEETYICDIRLRKKCREQIIHLENTYAKEIDFMKSGGAFTPELLERERARRSEIYDRIQALMHNEKQEHMAREAARQDEFDRVYGSWFKFCRPFDEESWQSRFQVPVAVPSSTPTVTPGRSEWRQKLIKLWKSTVGSVIT